MIKYENFVNNKKSTNISDFINTIILNNVPSNEIMEFKNDIKKILKINENLSINKLKFKYNKWLNDKLFKWLINRKKSFYIDLVNKMEVFNLDTLDDVFKNYPGFKLESLYLAGGMDEAEDTGKGWRLRLEYEFEINNNNNNNNNLPEIEIYNKKFNPSHIVNGEYLDNFLINPKKIINLYNKPLLLNPVRKEIDRTKDDTFDNMVDDLKNPDYDPNNNSTPFKWIRKTFSENIEPDDEHLLRLSSAVFLGQDSAAGAGTYGELELLSLIRKPLFAWLVNGYENKAGAFKLWNIPHLSKVARNTDEMIQLVKTILRYSK